MSIHIELLTDPEDLGTIVDEQTSSKGDPVYCSNIICPGTDKGASF